MAMDKLASEETPDVVHWVDRLLINFCRLFGTYTKGDRGSFSLDQPFSFLPQFLYHFRRSPFLYTFNSSPDQTTQLRHALITQDVTNSLFMIQPVLMRYALDSPPVPVLLDTMSIQPDCVLLLDTFFRVLVWHGAKIVAWRNEGYHEREEYANLRQVLEAPKLEVESLVNERFPTPDLIICDQDSSAARFLLARCNPSEEGKFDARYARADSLGTDEPSLNTFLNKLREMAVHPG
jgi:protein transport protein SEC23